MKRTTITALLGLALCTAASLASAAPSHIFVFGDSLSDSGNNTLAIAATNGGVPRYTPTPIANNSFVPTFTYASSGTYSDGPVWASQFASAMGVPLLNSLAPNTGAVPPALIPYATNFAFGGATTGGAGQTPSLSLQVAMAQGLNGNVLPSTALYVVAGGGNDARAIVTDALPIAFGGGDFSGILNTGINNYVLNLTHIVSALKASGASDIVLWNTPNLGATPALRALGAQGAGFASMVANGMNQALAAAMASDSTFSGVRLFDIYGLASTSLPGINTTDACAAQANCDPSKYFYWDGIHPTSFAHQIVADRMVAFVPAPGTLLLILPLALLGWRARRQPQAVA